jgi:hypothetical protein
MQKGKSIFAVFLVILILLAFFILIALWMMDSMDSTSHTGAAFWLIDKIGQGIGSIMTILSEITSWVIDHFWGIIGNSG